MSSVADYTLFNQIFYNAIIPPIIEYQHIEWIDACKSMAN